MARDRVDRGSRLTSRWGRALLALGLVAATVAGGSSLAGADDPDVPLDLVLDHTVDASFDRTRQWTIDKEADDLSPAADPVSGIADVDYTVTVTPDGSSDGGWVVEGVISVFNPNQSIEMVATVTDSNPGTDCTAPNGTDVVIGGGQTVDVAYSCEFSTQPDLNGQNTASVRWKDAAGTLGIDAEKRNDVSYTSADWSITEIYDVVDVVDDKTDPANPVHLGVAAWNADGTPTVFEYLLPLHVDTVGCVEFTNTAWLDWHHQQAVETVEVCRGEVPAQNLVVSQSVDASFDRTYLWSIDKAADDRWPEADPVSGIAEVDYTVTVTPDGSSDGGWVISGMVSVYNPNDESVTVATDVTHNGVPCSVPGGPFILVGADSTAERPYSCVFSDQPSYDGTTRATVTRVMGYVTPSTSVANETAYSSADWSLTEIDDVIEVIDDQTDPANPVNLGDAVWNAEGTPTVFEYLLPLHVDPDECVEFTNTAWIDQSPQQAVETVEVCRGEDQARNLVVDHSVLMSLERTNLWSINKETEGSPQVNPASGIADVNYTVTATPNGSIDSAWVISGIISVYNPNRSINIDAEVSYSPLCSLPATVSVTVAAGSTVEVPYSCVLPGQPSSVVTSAAKVTWASGYGTTRTSASSEASYGPDDWSLTEIDHVVDVIDDQTDPANPVELGSADWNESGTPTEFTYSLQHQATPGSCTDFTNRAWIDQTQQEAVKTVEVCTGLLRLQKAANSAELLADGSWSISYQIEVFNDSEHPAGYNLTDTLDFGTGLIPIAARWSLEGTDQTGDWNDLSDTTTATLAEGRGLDGATSHRYIVTATAEVPGELIGTGPAQCSGVDGTGGGGFLNLATLTAAGGTSSTAACAAPQASPWSLSVTADPMSGATVTPGDTIRFTVTATPTTDVSPVGVVVHHDLIQVLTHGDITGDIVASTGATTWDSDVLVWNIGTLDGTASLMFSVTVDGNAWDASMVTTASGTGSSPPTCEECSTTHTTPPQPDPIDPDPTDPSDPPDPNPIDPDPSPGPGPGPSPGPDPQPGPNPSPGPGPESDPTTPGVHDSHREGASPAPSGEESDGQTRSRSGRSLPRTGDDFAGLFGIGTILMAAGTALAIGASRRARA